MNRWAIDENMRISRVYCPEVDAKTTQIPLSKSLSHYLIQVLRNKKHATVILFNNQDSYEYYADITEANARQTIVAITDRKIKNNESNITINIFQAIAKGDKFSTIVQKSTELGITSITPVITEYAHANIADNKIGRWQKIAIHAAEQSGRVFFPIIHPIATLGEVLSKRSSTNLILSPNATKTIKQLMTEQPKAQSFNILIGPEGGFSQNEITLAAKASYNSIALGSRILRTETASIAISAILQTLWGDF